MRLKFRLLFRLFRVRQWIKNLLLFVPLIFAKRIFDGMGLIRVIIGVLLFCVITSCVYMLNDVIDIKRDREHPIKKFRPIARGEVSKKEVFVMVSVLLPVGLVLGLFLEMSFGIVMMLYLLNSYLYSCYFKRMIIMDVISIAMGIVLRVVAGAEIVDVYISPWILLCVLFLTLFLELNKRKSEVVLLGDKAIQFRESLGDYSLWFIDNMISITTAMTLISYSLYTFFSQQGIYLMTATIPVGIYGVFRYQYLVQIKNERGNSEDIKDKPLVVTIGLWCIVVVFALYF